MYIISTFTLYFSIVHVYAFVISVKVQGLFELNQSFADFFFFAQISCTLDLVIKTGWLILYIFVPSWSCPLLTFVIRYVQP